MLAPVRETTYHRSSVSPHRLRRTEGSEMRFRPRTLGHRPLDLLIRAMGGPAEAARHMSRDRSTLNRWRTGARPIPAWAATRMRELATDISQEMIRLAYDLKTDIREGEERAARGRAARVRTFLDAWRARRVRRLAQGR
jgi:hypothetical protein